MAKTSAVNDEEHKSIKMEGDLHEFKLFKEDRSETDNDNDSPENSWPMVASKLVKSSPPPVYGSVSIANSENVQFGNNTYFNGPVTIKQIIQNSPEQDNAGYEHDEDLTSTKPSNDNIQPPKTESKDEDLDHCLIWNYNLCQKRWWLQIAISAFCVIVVGSIISIVIIVLYNATQGDNPTTSSTTTSKKTSECAMVEGQCHNMLSLDMFVVPLLVMVLSCLWYILYNLYIKLILTQDWSFTHAMLKPKKKKKNYDVEGDPLLIAPNHLRIVSRTDWLARPVENELDVLRLPAPWVIITHTDTESCTIQSECVLRVRLIQMFHVESRGWFDIGYNFLVAGDGSAYHGRGWDYVGAHTLGYNKYSIGIAFIGTFNTKEPPKKQIEACQKLINRGVQLGKIAKDYKLFGHRQLASTLSPGDKLYEIIKEWPHFVNNYTDITELVPNY